MPFRLLGTGPKLEWSLGRALGTEQAGRFGEE